jgi:hypothetical protein
LKVVSPVSPLG